MQSDGTPSPPIRAAQDSNANRPHRRTRVPLSCEPCRARKLRCNRERPCQNCTARGELSACKFQAPRNGDVSGQAANRAANGDMRQRIDRLEDLVKTLLAERSHNDASSQQLAKNRIYTPESPHATPDVVDVADVAGVGKTVMDGIHSVYVGGDDWHAVLEQVNELKQTWSQHLQDDYNDDCLHPTLSHMVDGSSLLFNQVKPIERIEILSSLPPKPQVDRLVSRFFNYGALPIHVPPLLHEATFMREYNEHWKDLSRSGFIWLGLLFSILSINMLAFHQYGEPPEYEGISESLFQLYRMRTAQCLLNGDIAKCLPYTVETLRFNATAELNRKDDNCRGLWIMSGVLVRAAVNMGYHREPAESSGISVLQAEYRRRVWLSVTGMDDVASFLGGFPRMTSAIDSDTAEPRNLHDWELTDDTTSLPPSRPLAELTSATYLIVKGRLFNALGRVAEFNSANHTGSYKEVLEIDRAVFDAYENFPPHMKVTPIVEQDGSSSGSTPSTPDFSNLSLLSLYQKGMCTLHRRFLVKAKVDNRFKFSQDRCIASALAILAYQPYLEPSFYQLSQPRQILTLGAIILFVELELRRQYPDAEASPDTPSLLRALEKSCTLWEEAIGTCDEAGRIYHFFAKLLSGCEGGIETASQPASSLAIVPEMSTHLSGSTAPIDTADGTFSFEKDLTTMDFDWSTLDAFIGETSYETGPLDSIFVELNKDYM